MYIKTILATAALASTLAMGPAKADPTFSFGVGFGADPFSAGYSDGTYMRHYAPRPWGFDGPDYGWDHPHYAYGYRISCGAGVNVVRSRGFHGVRPVDCSAPVYGYQGWKYGRSYDIQVSMRGQVIGVSPSDW
jgi:hypothetical protein